MGVGVCGGVSPLICSYDYDSSMTRPPHYHRSPLVNPVNSVHVQGAAGVDRYAETRLVCVKRFGVRLLVYLTFATSVLATRSFCLMPPENKAQR